MKTLTAVAITALSFLNSCTKEAPEQYDMHIGDTVTKMNISDDITKMEDAYLARVMPL